MDGAIIPYLVTGMAVCLLGCSYDPCIEGVEEGGHYVVNVVERYTPEGNFTYEPGLVGSSERPSCGAVDSLSSVGVLPFDVFGFFASAGDGGCNNLLARPSDDSVVTVLTDLHNKVGLASIPTNILMSHEAKVGECRGFWGVAISSAKTKGGPIFSAPEPGTLPSVFAQRWFVSREGPAEKCPESCKDTFVAYLSRR